MKDATNENAHCTETFNDESAASLSTYNKTKRTLIGERVDL